MHSYLAEKNFLYLYLYKMFYRGATAPIHIFIGTGLVHIGASLSTVLLFYALTIAVLALASPLGVVSISRYGVRVSAIFAILGRLGFFICLLFVEQGYDKALWLGALFYGFSYGILPLKDILEAVYIKGDSHRGKQMTMGMVLSGGMVALVVALTGYLIALYGFMAIALLSLSLQSFSVALLMKMKGEPLQLPDYKISDGFKATIKEKPLAGVYLMVWAQQIVFTAGVVVLPLYMFHIIGDIKSFALVAAGASLLEIFVTLFFGRYLDNSLVGTAKRKSSYMTVCSAIILILFVKTPLSAMLADSFNKISMNIQLVSTSTSIHQLLRLKNKEKLLLFSAVWQMTYAFFEIPLLIFLAIIHYYFGLTVFTVTFVLAGFAGLLSYYNFSQQKEQQRKGHYNGT